MVFEVDSPRPIVRVLVDLIGDGQPEVIVLGDDLRPVRALAFVPAVQGKFWLSVGAWMQDGCGDQSGQRRWVEVQ